MTAQELLKGLEEMLKRHPECADWSIFNTDELCVGEDFCFVPPDHPHMDFSPEYARVDHWLEQEWVYEAIGKEIPSDVRDLAKRAARVEATKDALRKRYPDDVITDRRNGVVALTEHCKVGDIYTNYDLFNGVWGEKSVKTLIRLNMTTEKAFSYKDHLSLLLDWYVSEIADKYANRPADEWVKEQLEADVLKRIESHNANTDNPNKTCGIKMSLQSLELVTLDENDGVSPYCTVVVATFGTLG